MKSFAKRIPKPPLKRPPLIAPPPPPSTPEAQNEIIHQLPFSLCDIYTLPSRVLMQIQKRAFEEAQFYNPNRRDFRYPDSQILFEIRNNVIQKQITHIPKDKFRSRLDITIDFIQRVVKQTNYKINGNFIINLHDKSDQHPNVNEIVFTKHQNTQKSIIPDIYAMESYKRVSDIPDPIPFSQKKGKGIFIGVTTGNTNPRLNDRLKLCNYAYQLKHQGQECFMDIFINHIAQIPEEEISKVFPHYQQFMKSDLSIQDQRQYRYIINVDGNTTSWDRLVWVYQGNNILIKQKSENMGWYYPFMEMGKHYVEYTSPADLHLKIEVMERMWQRNPNRLHELMKTQREFLQNYLSPLAHLTYTCMLFHEISKKYREL
jgi:hypothetical protein